MTKFRLTDDFQECKRDILELKDDNPAALDFVLRYIYSKQPCIMTDDKTLAHLPEWRFWLDVHITATKYLVPDLSKNSRERLAEVARSQKALDDTIDILDALTSERSHSDGLAGLANELRNANIKQLLQSERYRGKLESDKALLWAHVDRLFVATQPVVGESLFFLAPARTTRQLHIINDGDVEGKVYFNYEGSVRVEGDF